MKEEEDPDDSGRQRSSTLHLEVNRCSSFNESTKEVDYYSRPTTLGARFWALFNYMLYDIKVRTLMSTDLPTCNHMLNTHRGGCRYASTQVSTRVPQVCMSLDIHDE